MHLLDPVEMTTHANKLPTAISGGQQQRVAIARTVLIEEGEIVNEYVAQALPTLSHQQMLHATRSMQSLHFAPGEPIIQADTHGDQFYIVKAVSVFRQNWVSNPSILSYRFPDGRVRYLHHTMHQE